HLARPLDQRQEAGGLHPNALALGRVGEVAAQLLALNPARQETDPCVAVGKRPPLAAPRRAPPAPIRSRSRAVARGVWLRSWRSAVHQVAFPPASRAARRDRDGGGGGADCPASSASRWRRPMGSTPRSTLLRFRCHRELVRPPYACTVLTFCDLRRTAEQHPMRP